MPLVLVLIARIEEVETPNLTQTDCELFYLIGIVSIQLNLLQETPVWSKIVSCSNVSKFYHPDDWKVKDNLEVAMSMGYLNDILGGRFAYPCQFDPYYKEKIEVYLGSGERAVQAVEQDDAEPYLSSVGFAFSAVEEDERHQDIISSVPPHVEPIPQKQSRQRKRALEGTE